MNVSHERKGTSCQTDSENANLAMVRDKLSVMQTEYARQLAPALMDIEVSVQIVVGSTTKRLSELLSLEYGELVTLDQKVGDPVQVVVNGCVVATGELVVSETSTPEIAVAITSIPELR